MKKIALFAAALALVAGPAHAGPVAAVVAWVGSTIAAGGVMGFVVQMAVSTGLSLLAQAFAKKPSGPKMDVSFDVRLGDDHPLSFVMGDYVTAGKRKYIGSWGKNTVFITDVIEVSSLPQGLSGVWVDDERGRFIEGRRGGISTSWPLANIDNIGDYPDGSLPAGVVDVGAPLDNYRDNDDTTDPRLWVKFIDGTQTEADPFLVHVLSSDPDYPWTADMIGTGKSYAIITARYDQHSLQAYPNFMFKPEPLPVYDPRLDSTNGGSGPQRWSDPATWQPSRNPAIIAYNIVRGIYFGSEWVFGGKDLPAWRLPVAEWIAAANECDAPEPLAGGGTEPAYRCGVEIHVDMAAADVLEEIGRAANMKFAEVGGQIKPVVGLPGAAVYSFTDEEIIITEGQSFKPFVPVSETFNAISATYPEPDEKWATKDSPEYIDTDATAADGGRYLPTSISYPAAPYAQQVQRLQRSQLQDYRRFRRHQFYLPPEAYALEPGIDMVSWTSQRNGYLSKQFLVESVSKTPGMNVLVSLREVDPGDYDWSSDFEVPVSINPPVNPLPFVQPINGLIAVGDAILDASSNQRRPAIRVSCDGNEAGVTQIQIEARIAGRIEVVIDTQRRFTAPFNWYLLDVLPDTAYEVRARLLSDLTPRSAWSSWLSVTTPDVGVGLEDLSGDVLDKLQELEDWLDGTDQDIADLRDDIAADIEAVDDRVDETRADLATAVDLLEQNALDLLDVAQGYTDTQVLSEAQARQSDRDALAARIDALSAAIGQNGLIANGSFENNLDGWTMPSGGARVAKGPSNTLTESMPADWAVQLPSIAGAALIYQTTASFTISDDDQFQYRFSAGSMAASRTLETTVRWFDALDAEILPATVQPVTISGAGLWKVYSAKLPAPTGATYALFQIRNTQTGGSLVYVTNIEASIVNAAIEARVVDLEAAMVTLDEALTIFKSEATARFGDNEAAIMAEGAARANADSAISDRVDTVEATTGQNEAAITTIQTAITALDEAIAQTEETVAARFGAAELVRDGVFARGLTWWTGGLASQGSVTTKDLSGSWFRQAMPADQAFVFTQGSTGWMSSNRAPASPGDVLDLSAQYARTPSRPTARIMTILRRADGSSISTLSAFADGASATQWLTVSQTGIVAPAETATSEVRVQVEADGTSDFWITNISLRRRQAFEHQTAAEVSTLTQAFSDLDGAMATLTTTVNSNYNSLDGRVTSNATALNQRYTKAETNTAISTAIDSYDVSVTNRLGQKANASVVNEIDTRVTNTETVANSKNRVWRQANAPANPTAGDIWFQSNNKNKAFRWNGSNWTSIEDGDIPEIKSDLSAQSTSITQVQSRTDRGTATGLMRVATESTPSGVQARIGLRAEANANQTSKSAALFLDARSDGTSQVTIAADRFAIAHNNNAGANRFVPFIVDGNVVYIDEARIREAAIKRAHIQELAVDTFRIAGNAVSVYQRSWTAGNITVTDGVGWVNIQSLTYTPGRTGPKLIDVHMSLIRDSVWDFLRRWEISLTRTQGGSTSEIFFAQSNMGDETAVNNQTFEMLYNGIPFTVLDPETSNSPVTYTLRTRTYSSPRVFNQRFLGVLDVYK